MHSIRSQIGILRDLRKDYQDKMVSALIGAGFSKNVSEKYLSWNGLLSDMINSLYKEEMEVAYDRYCQKTYLLSRKTAEEFLWEYKEKIAQRDGYLEIVSKYWRKKGYREAIEAYVEEHTPYLFLTEEDSKLYIDGRTIPVTENAFSVHKELLKCDKFCNFYTTNYDNLLEAIDERWSVSDPNIVKMERVVERKDLSDSMRKASIIKIHGSLRSPKPENHTFGFDKDNGLCYILAKEDYESYTARHEAFAYFMRIAMLSGKFCLIGFSGTDPNYLSWVDWMKDVISGNDTQKTKIYFINVNEKENVESIPHYKSLFYKNHRIEQIDLFDSDVVKELGLDARSSIYDSLEGDLKDEKRSCQELLIGLFRYLRKEEPDNINGEKQQINEAEHSSPVFVAFGSNQSTQKILDYQALWNEVLRKITKKEDYAKDIEDIKSAKRTHRFFKSYSVQREVAFQLHSKQAEWSDMDADAFLIAAEDAGLLVTSSFTDIQENTLINKKELYLKHLERAITLGGCPFEDINVASSNWSTYEHIMRCLFHLNYYRAKTIAEEWDASGTWILNKAMVLSWFEDKVEASKQIIDEYVNDMNQNEQERMFASIYGNILSREYPFKYKFAEFRTKNVDDLNVIIDFYMKDATAKLQKPTRRGAIENTFTFGTGKERIEAESSLRALLFIINTAMPLEYKNICLLDSKKWYAIFSWLYVKYPAPCFYYSIQYNDEKVLTRIGQDFASCRKLDGNLTDILTTALAASVNEHFPKWNLNGLYYITAQMYIVVDEDAWFEMFWSNVLIPFLKSIANQKRQDAIYTNVAMACVAMSNSKRIAKTIDKLLQHFEDNSHMVVSLICESMNLRLIDKKDVDGIFGKTYDEVIANNTLRSTIRLMYVFQYYGLLNEERVKSAIKILDKNINDLKALGKDSLIFACSVKGKSKDVTNELKRIILSSDIWFNGKLEGGGWTCPDRIPANRIIEELALTQDEMQALADNLSENVKGLMDYVKQHGCFHLFGDYYLDYLNDALDFIAICKKKYQNIDLSETEKLIIKIYTAQTQTENLQEMLANDDTSTFCNALDRLDNILRIAPLKDYRREFGLILNRAILKEPLALNKLIRTIYLISFKNKDELKSLGFVDDLLMLLTVMRKAEDEYSSLNFNLYRGFNNLYFLARVLKSIGVENSSITYWTTDAFVLKFIKNRKEG